MLFLFHLVLVHTHTLRAFYLHICVALSIHSQHTTYFDTLTFTQLMLTLSCRRVHFKGFWRENGWLWVGLSMIHYQCDVAL